MTDSKPSGVAWRWKSKDGSVWFYDPDPEWLSMQSPDEIDAEQLFLEPVQPDPVGYALAIEQAAAIIGRIAKGYQAGGDGAIACAVYLTEGNIRSLTPPADRLAAVLAMPEVRAVIRQAMAAYQMAYAEADRDVETPEEADRIVGLWFGKWMVESYPLSHETEAHSGDCTKQPWSCLRCHAEEALASVDASLKEWDRRAALAALVQP